MNTIHYELYISAKYANPNGDPQDDGRPRQSSGGYGEISPVSIKRHLRNVAAVLVEENPDKYNPANFRFFQNTDDGLTKKQKSEKYGDSPKLFWDSRVLGEQHMFSGQNSVVRHSAISVTPALSLEPIEIIDMQITSSVPFEKTSNKNKKKKSEDEGDENDGEEKKTGKGTMGFIHYVKDAVYRCYISTDLRGIKENGVSKQDLELFEDALRHIYCYGSSLTRPFMHIMVDKLVKVEHPDTLSIPFRAVSAIKEGDHYIYNIDEKLLKERKCKATVLV